MFASAYRKLSAGKPGNGASRCQALLTEKAARLHPGESGLLALDWWNGNRSVLANAQLSGVILGLTLKTRTEEIYRALLESTAYGAREIIDGYRNGGVPIDEVRVSGGIALKNPLAMQIYADVLQLPLSVTEAAQGPGTGQRHLRCCGCGCI